MLNNKFYKKAVNFITGKIDNFSVSGTEVQCAITKECLLASRALYEALESQDTKLSEILVLAENKNLVSKEYSNVFRKRWLL